MPEMRFFPPNFSKLRKFSPKFKYFLLSPSGKMYDFTPMYIPLVCLVLSAVTLYSSLKGKKGNTSASVDGFFNKLFL